jgi:type I restriction enzyme M protein
MSVSTGSLPLFQDDIDGVEDAETVEVSDEEQIFNLLHKSDGDRMVKRTEKEEALQAVARALVFEYNFDLSDLERNFAVRLSIVLQATGKTKSRSVKLDLAAFRNGSPRTQENIIRAGIVAPPGTKSDDEKRGIVALDDILGGLPGCEVGFWTNGTELAFRRKIMVGNEPEYQDVGDMPAAGETFESLENQKGRRRLVAVTSETLAQTFHRCHDYLHGNQGLNKSQAFWEFLRLIFCKMYDEQREAAGRERRFWVGLTERFTPEGQQAIKERITALFEDVKGQGSIPSEYAAYFRPDETIGLNAQALAYIAGELSRYELLNSSEDAKGLAYEVILDRKQKADRGQFFTPRNVINLMVAMMDPCEADYILDPACGTGGFLVVAFRHVRHKIEARLRETWANPKRPTPEESAELRHIAKAWASEHIYGFDFDPDLVKATQMNLAMNGADGKLYHLDSLKYPGGATEDAPRLVREINSARYKTADPPVGDFNTFTLCLTNPPFGSKIPFTDRAALQGYGLAANARPDGSIDYTRQGQAAYKKNMAPEILFIERCVQWVRPGGKVGIVLPDGILGNPKDEYIRRWILSNCDVLASIDLPVETFLPQVGVQPSLLFLRKKTDEDKDAEALRVRPDQSVFMAIVDKVGKDRRGNVIYKRNPDGTDAPPKIRTERRPAFRDGVDEMVEIHFEEPVVDDDLPDVLNSWQQLQTGNED